MKLYFAGENEPFICYVALDGEDRKEIMNRLGGEVDRQRDAVVGDFVLRHSAEEVKSLIDSGYDHIDQRRV